MHIDNNEDRCWICLSPKTNLNDTDWRRPCNCRLFAHEKCLLSWTDKVSRTGQTPQSPLCRRPIRLVRDSFAALVWRSKAESAITSLVLRALAVKTVSGILHSAVSSLFSVGSAVLDAVCGTKRAQTLVGVRWLDAPVPSKSRVCVFVPSARSYFLICAIPIYLASSTIEVSVFKLGLAAFLPLFLKVTDTDTDTDTTIVAALPAINVAYCLLHQAVVKPLIQHFEHELDNFDPEPNGQLVNFSVPLFPFWFTPSVELRTRLLQHVVPRVRRLTYAFAWPFLSRVLGDCISFVPKLQSLVPSSTFRRTLVAGAVIVICRDLVNILTAYMKLKQARSTHIQDI